MDVQSNTPYEEQNLEICKLLLDEWKWRHQHCWTSLRQYGLAAVTVSIVPYVKPELIHQLGKAVILFPAVAWTLVVFGTWLFAGEYVRSNAALVQYHQLLGRFRPDSKEVAQWKYTFFGRIGWTTPHLFAVSGAVLCITNAYFLNLLVFSGAPSHDGPFAWKSFWITITVLVGLNLAVYFFILTRWIKGRERAAQKRSPLH